MGQIIRPPVVLTYYIVTTWQCIDFMTVTVNDVARDPLYKALSGTLKSGAQGCSFVSLVVNPALRILSPFSNLVKLY